MVPTALSRLNVNNGAYRSVQGECIYVVMGVTGMISQWLGRLLGWVAGRFVIN